MADRPILFSAPMVRALIEGRKTQTRRVIKPTPKQVEEWNPDLSICPSASIVPEYVAFDHPGGGPFTCVPLHFVVGDRLWVKETWRAGASWDDNKPRLIQPGAPVDYLASPRPAGPAGKTRVAIFMPRWASRLTLTVTEVRVERLQNCSEADAIAEGVERHPEFSNLWRRGPLAGDQNIVNCTGFAKLAFRSIWEAINGAKGWAANPWVVAVTFTVEQRNIDA